MTRKVGIGHQDFETIQKTNNFYIDKTDFIRQWWESNDEVTLITRPRRFGKTLNMSMIEQFFSLNYANKTELFENLSIWQHPEYHNLHGSYPVLFLSFANVKETSFQEARKKICYIIETLYNKHEFLLENNLLNEKETKYFQHVSADMEDYIATSSLGTLSEYLFRFYRKKIIILLDEYDTPMQEAYINGYWDELSVFIRNLFHATFKTNPYLKRAIMTGITRISKESIFSDLNNLEVVTTTSEKYADCFGFTEEEVSASLAEFNLSDKKHDLKKWYNGFTFGKQTNIYNPWSILNYLDKNRLAAYWANTSSNHLVGKLLRESSGNIKQDFERLLQGKTLKTQIDEQIVYNQLDNDEQAVWGLLLASGYLKVRQMKIHTTDFGEWMQEYELELTNFEVTIMFRNMVHRWFSSAYSDYNGFIRALLADDLKAMNAYMNRVALTTFSYFDTGKNPSIHEPERFYHGFVLGLMVELSDRYVMSSNRESGFGRYDILLEPRQAGDCAYILEFKVQDHTDETDLSDTVQAALLQIEEKKYETVLTAKGIPKDRIRKYGFAFCGKKVLIGNVRSVGQSIESCGG